MRVLVVNAGSSSLKLTLLDHDDRVVNAREIDAQRGTLDTEGLSEALHQGLAPADAVGHRIVHGGERFRAAVRVAPEVEEALRALTDLAPLHQPKSLDAMDAVSAALPDLPAVACFDTAYHATIPAAAATYALPAAWRQRWGLRRYGFHGLSHAWVARRVPELLARPPGGLRLVSCHLGAGASLCAIADGRSVDTTMGFTPLEGLVMATRSGSVDPGLLLWVAQRGPWSSEEMADALEHDAGLKGLAGTADMREVLARAGRGEEAATLAREVYLHRLRAAIAAMAAALGGLDALAFTGGVGERSSELRARAMDGCAFLGLAVDDIRNRAPEGDAVLSAPGTHPAVVVVAAREDLEIARQVRELLGPRAGAGD